MCKPISPQQILALLKFEKADGGVGGIRTPEGLHPTRFPGVRLKPLGHDSVRGRSITGKSQSASKLYSYNAQRIKIASTLPCGRG